MHEFHITYIHSEWKLLFSLREMVYVRPKLGISKNNYTSCKTVQNSLPSDVKQTKTFFLNHRPKTHVFYVFLLLFTI